MDEELRKEKLDELEEKWLNGTITPEEAELYATWYNKGQDEPVEIPEAQAINEYQHGELMFRHVLVKIEDDKGQNKSKGPKQLSLILKWSAAAAVLIIGCMAIWLQESKNKNARLAADKPAELRDVMPGKNGAILTISDGSKIVLDSRSNGLVARQNAANVVLDNGQLKYEAKQVKVQQEVLNTMSTPRGRQYKVILPDGTQVWLNAASSLTYPTAFNGADREVSLLGEAYFEVAHNKDKPFHVKVGAMDVRVLGTHFNVTAYPDERIVQTTLLEGSVEVADGRSVKKIVPGQMVLYKPSAGQMEIMDADTAEAVAWKNGLFYFHNEDMVSVMNKISRWYDIDVVYKGEIPHRDFGGKVYRNYNLSDVLAVLRASHIHFSIEGKTLIVEP